MGFWCFCGDHSPYIHRTPGFENSYNLIQNRREFQRSVQSSLPGGGYEEGYETAEQWKSFSFPFAIRGDGTLWCFQSSSFSHYWKAAGIDGRPYRPIQVGTDTDWQKIVSLGDRSFFLLKSDGTLWGLGNAFRWGERREFTRLSESISDAFKARISSSIRSCSRNGSVTYSKKPTARLVKFSSPSGTVNNSDMVYITPRGSGASLSVRWAGKFPDEYVQASDENNFSPFVGGKITVDSQGSGYTSVPSVVVTPADDTTPAQEELASFSAVVTSMTRSLVERFEVISGGSGYTTATAYEIKTGATAEAIIANNGTIAGWSVTSHGTTPRLNPLVSGDVQVVGDGVGGAARAVPYPSGVLAAHATGNPAIWSSPPTVRVTAAGGSGASLSVPRLSGTVSDIDVINGGSGYTQSNPSRLALGNLRNGEWLGVVLDPDPSDDLNDPTWRLSGGRDRVQFLVQLNESPVDAIESTMDSGEVYPCGHLTRPGTFRPSELYPYSAAIYAEREFLCVGVTVHSVESRNRETGEIINWEFDAPNARWVQPNTIEGWNVAPDTCVLIKQDTSNFSSTPPYSLTSYIGQYYLGFSIYVIWGTIGGGGQARNGFTISAPLFSSPPTVASPQGITSTYGVQDGSLCLQSVTPIIIPYVDGHEPPGYDQHATVTAVEYFEGPVGFYLPNSDGSSYDPPRPSSWLGVYMYPDKFGGQFAFASGIITKSGDTTGVRDFNFPDKTRGSGFTYEPDLSPHLDFFLFPQRIQEGLTFKSISPHVLVSTDGSAFVRVEDASQTASFVGSGFNFAPSDPTRFAPLGQGVYISCDDTWHDNQFTATRFIVDRPAAGSPAFIRNSGTYVDHDPYKTQLTPFVYCREFNIASSSDEVSESFGPPKFRVAGFAPASIVCGWGYTSAPRVRFLERPNGTPPNLTVTLVGPTSFDYVTEQGDILVGTDGASYTTASLTNSQELTNALSPDYFVTNQRSTLNRTWGIKPIYKRSYFSSANYDWVSTSNVVEEFGVSYLPAYEFTFGSVTPIPDFLKESETLLLQHYTYAPLLPYPGQVIEDTFPFSPSGLEVGFEGVRTVHYQAPVTAGTPRGESLRWGRNFPGFSATSGGSFVRPFFFEHRSALPITVNSAHDNFSLYSTQVPWPSTMRRIAAGRRVVASYAQTGDPDHALLSDGTMLFFPRGSDGNVYEASTFAFRSVYSFEDTRYSGTTSLFGPYARNNSDGTFYSASFQRRPPQPAVLATSIAVSDHGSGYSLPPRVVLPQSPDVATFDCDFSAEVTGVAVVRPGHGYTSPPSITAIEDHGTGATFSATIQGPLHDCRVTASNGNFRCEPEVRFLQPGISGKAVAGLSGYVESIVVADGGRGYREPPHVTIRGSGDEEATASAVANISGYVEAVLVSSGGGGYTAAPVISFSGGGGTGAAAVALIAPDADGTFMVSKVVVTNHGSGYTSSPTVTATPVDENGSGFSGSCRLNAAVSSISVANGGSGYSSTPAVELPNTIGVGKPATASAVSRFSLSSIRVTKGGEYRAAPAVSIESRGHVDALTLSSAGSGYSSAPLLQIVDSCGVGATAFCTIDGQVTHVSVAGGGRGYAVAPLVTLVGGYSPSSGSRASAEAVINKETGLLVSINITDAGSGYFEPPTVRFSPVDAAILQIGEVDEETGGIISVNVVSGGYGYGEPPAITVVHPRGRDAELEAVVSGGVITAVVVVEEGERYTNQGALFSVSYPQPTAHATAVASISGGISSVTLTDCGRNYEPDHPPAVLVIGGGGTGAAITATVAKAGSAAAQARINGSILCVDVTNAGSDYKQEPRLEVDNSGNIFISESLAVLNTGGVTQEEHDDVVTQHSAVLASAISGKINSISVINPGSGYNEVGSYNSGDPPFVRASIQGSDVTLQGVLNADRGFSSVDLPPDEDNTFVEKPFLYASNAYAAEATLSAVGGAYSFRRELLVPPDFEPIQSLPAEYAAVRMHTGIGDSRFYLLDEQASVPECRIANYSTSYTSSRFYVLIQGSVAGFAVNDDIAGFLPPFAEEPTYTLEDPSGTGCEISLGYESGSNYWRQVNVSSGGHSYTLAGRISARGGTWEAWSNRATATATIDQSGRVVSVTVTSPGGGYSHGQQFYSDGITGEVWDGNSVDVFFSGGGGSGASAVASVNLATGGVSSIAVINGGSGYVSAPTVVIMDRLPPIQYSTYAFEKDGSYLGAFKAEIKLSTQFLDTLSVQCIYPKSLSDRKSRSIYTGQPLYYIDGHAFFPAYFGDSSGLQFFRNIQVGRSREHYTDGYVEFVNFTNAPSVSGGMAPRVPAGAVQIAPVNMDGNGATVVTKDIRWSTVLGVQE